MSLELNLMLAKSLLPLQLPSTSTDTVFTTLQNRKHSLKSLEQLPPRLDLDKYNQYQRQISDIILVKTPSK